jgi:hypothetical protein
MLLVSKDEWWGLITRAKHPIKSRFALRGNKTMATISLHFTVDATVKSSDVEPFVRQELDSLDSLIESLKRFGDQENKHLSITKSEDESRLIAQWIEESGEDMIHLWVEEVDQSGEEITAFSLWLNAGSPASSEFVEPLYDYSDLEEFRGYTKTFGDLTITKSVDFEVVRVDCLGKVYRDTV